MSLGALNPERILNLGRLDMIARLVVEGFLVGHHRSPFHGFSAEFAEYRHCMPGEPTTHVDWRVYARTDRAYRKVFSEETNLRATLLLDCSAGMGAAVDEAHLPKLDYARLLAACFAYLLLRQNDAVGLEVFDHRRRASIRPRALRRHLHRLLTPLQSPLEAGRQGVGEVLHDIAPSLPRRGLVLMFTDLWSDLDRTIAGVKHLLHRGNEVVVFCIEAPRVESFDYRGRTRFVWAGRPDEEVVMDPPPFREEFLAALAARRERFRNEFGGRRVELITLTTDQPVDRVLLEYLTRRRRLG